MASHGGAGLLRLVLRITGLAWQEGEGEKEEA